MLGEHEKTSWACIPHMKTQARTAVPIHQRTKMVLRPQKEGLAQELHDQFYSISITRNSLVCSNRAASGVKKWERERVQGSKEKTQALHDAIEDGV